MSDRPVIESGVLDSGATPADLGGVDLDPGISRAVAVIRSAGIETLSSCEGRDKPGYSPDRDGPHHGDWPYVILNGTAADAFLALGAALKEGLPVRSIEQSWFVYPESPAVPVGPQWRITSWEKIAS